MISFLNFETFLSASFFAVATFFVATFLTVFTFFSASFFAFTAFFVTSFFTFLASFFSSSIFSYKLSIKYYQLSNFNAAKQIYIVTLKYKNYCIMNVKEISTTHQAVIEALKENHLTSFQIFWEILRVDTNLADLAVCLFGGPMSGSARQR